MASDGATYMDSMSFKVSELLKEVQLDYSPAFTKSVDDVVSSIKKVIRKIPKDLQVTADLAPGFVRDIRADKVEFKFKRPKFYEIAGSYSMQCVTKPDVNVDLFIRIPKECFLEKDYLNYRYHAKRFLYLCVLKNHLVSSSLFDDICWSTFQNEARKPILLVKPEASENHAFVLRIIPTVDRDVFSLSKLNLARNNVRSLNQADVPQATPLYNSSILEDMVLEDNAEFIRRTFLGWKELREALVLLKVWARQRSSIYSHDCLNGFLISVIMTYLATESGGNRINKLMSPLQIFRVTLDFIAKYECEKNSILFHPQGERNVSNKEKMTTLRSFPVVICDSFADVNLGFRMSKNGFQELQGETELTLACLAEYGGGGFDEIFMTRIDFPAKYDYCVRLNLKGKVEGGFCTDDECWRIYEKDVWSKMAEGLEDRAKSIRVIWRNTTSGCKFEEGFSMLDGEELLIGISTKSVEEAYKKVTMGPSPEEKEEALKFRKFWGDKATLRQFRDSRIAEVVVWERDEWEKHLILKDLTEYILSRHFSLPRESICPIVDQLDFCLLYGNRDPITFSKSLLPAFDELSKRLRHLDDIPLNISSVQPLNSAFRFASVFPPMPHPLAFEKQVKLQKLTSTCIQPLEVMIQLEGSGNWPMDEVALEKTKSAFLLKIAESLQNKWGMTCSSTEDDVDVFMSGFAFRLRILHERGLNLVRRPGGSGPVKRVLSTDRKLFMCSQHSSMINGLCGRYPTYAPVVRLAKRWVSAHLLSSLLVEEAIELLVAHLFLKPFPFTPPMSRITGFLRFLRLLSDYDWMFSALVVDINGDLTSADQKEINENFMSSRKNSEENPQDASPAMFLAAAYDKASEAWTRTSPTATELKRLVTYATSGANLLSKLIMHKESDSHRWECLFRTPLDKYDAVVLLHRDKMPFPHRLLFPSEIYQGRLIAQGQSSKFFYPFILPAEGKNIKQSLEELKTKVMVDFDPVRCFINDMERDFPETFKVWYDSLGGDAIGLTWSKANLQKRSRDMMEDDDIEPVDTLKAVGEVGKGLVRSIHLLKVPKLRH
ncbi:OLC1v1015496C1 [Oldenlandia corymbosa var. corymbosa]|uniref:OLC1v1015496C1 n=1 Tax=Oldenlandia corymbosa var. corymbosa TaxID=529605 RepID=A0AAV1E3D3_OLDCO|nr:OLC1v1015496C1 [Oldenlandia corymbosa var. corymbosa]